jgi:hypothetical protein
MVELASPFRCRYRNTVFLPGIISHRMNVSPHVLNLFLKRVGVVFSRDLNVRVNWLWS